MVQRPTLIAVLIGIEVALVVGMIGAIRGSWGPSYAFQTAGASVPPAGGTHWSFAAGSHPSVTVAIGHADLTVETLPGAQIAVTVVPGVEVNSSGPIRARDEGGTIRISAEDSEGASRFYVDDRNIHVIVPPETHVIVEQAGDIDASGLRAPASFESSHGDISIHDFRGQLSATSSDGRLEISDADCPTLHVASSNGRVTLTRVTAAQIDASSSNGRVEGTALQLRDGRVSSSNGRVSLGFASGADTTVSAASSNGHVHVSGFPSGPTTAVKHGDDDDSDDDSDSSAATTVRVGAGSGRLNVHASNGSINLSQEG
jgi:Putative adhesin